MKDTNNSSEEAEDGTGEDEESPEDGTDADVREEGEALPEE